MKFPVEWCVSCHMYAWSAELGRQHLMGALEHSVAHLKSEEVKTDQASA